MNYYKYKYYLTVNFWFLYIVDKNLTTCIFFWPTIKQRKKKPIEFYQSNANSVCYFDFFSFLNLLVLFILIKLFPLKFF